MSDKPKFPRALATSIAQEYVDFLTPYCEKIEIAGSLRRRKEEVGDIEILFIPKTEVTRDFDMFKWTKVDLAWRAIDAMLRTHVLAKRPNVHGHVTWGDLNKLGFDPETGIPVDFFTATAENWFNFLVVRTGPAENNIRIATAAQAKGWKWNTYGDGFTRGIGLEAHRAESEQDVFEFVGLEYREPWER